MFALSLCSLEDNEETGAGRVCILVKASFET